MSGGKDISLSVDETNRLRAELGLKPLRPKASESALPLTGKSFDLIHAPPPSNGRSTVSNSSSANQRPHVSSVAVAAVLGLNDDDDEDDDEDDEDAGAWVERMRRETQKSGTASRKRPRTLSPPRDVGTAIHDLAGTRVQHSRLDALAEGEEAVLTMADTSVLDESGLGMNEDADVLVSVEDRETVVACEATRLRNGAAVADLQYDPTDDAEFREAGKNGGGGAASILRKYDALEVAADFQIGGDGVVLQPQRDHAAKDAARFRAAADISKLEGDEPEGSKFVSDYYTKEEFAAFKPKKQSKSKTKKKKRRDNEKAAIGEAELNGVSSRASVEKYVHEADDDDDEEAERLARLKALRSAAAAAEPAGDENDEDGDVDTKLQESLARARRAAAKARGRSPASSGAKAVFKVVTEARKGEDEEEDALPVILTEAEQFVRSIGRSGPEDGDTNAIGDVGTAARVVSFVKDPENYEMLDAADDETAPPTGNSGDSTASAPGGRAAASILPVLPAASIPDDDFAVNQPMGLAHLLARVRALGELNRPKEQAGRVRDKRVDWQAVGGGHEVKLSYKDDQGRDVTPKEAFRIMSHKFHGKGPGANKREAAMRRQLKNKELRHSSVANDAPLASVAALLDETKKTKSAHVVLSGAAAIRDIPAGIASDSVLAPAASHEVKPDAAPQDSIPPEADVPRHETAKRSRTDGETVAFSIGKRPRRH
jgi:U4/U6.U5 tri-snRNP-associated protein 1